MCEKTADHAPSLSRRHALRLHLTAMTVDSAFLRRLPLAIRRQLQQTGLSRSEDVALRFPLRYENWSALQPIASLHNGQSALVEGIIVDAQIRFWRGDRRQLLVQLEDANGDSLTARFFNMTVALERSMPVGRRLRLRGTVKFGRGWEITHPQIQAANAPGKMQAIYPALGSLSQKHRQQLAATALHEAAWEETVPADLRPFIGGETSAAAALAAIHMPPADAAVCEALQAGEHMAWRRLRFDELLAHQIILRARYRRRLRRHAEPLLPPPQWDAQLRAALPFTPTAAQQKAIAEIIADLRRCRPMHRLLQGDVGSGKTVVAAFACLAAAKSGRTAVLMAPTEILARQHYQTMRAYFAAEQVQCELLVGAIRGAKRRESLARLRLGLSRIAVGTHALFQEESRLDNVGVVIIDEQHRFGVHQRQALIAAGNVHQLMMSATPIPRTLAMSAFADLDLSVLDELPAGRQPVSTILIPHGRRDEVLARIGRQSHGAVYWVCPRIDEAADELQDVSSMAEQARRDYPHLSSAVLHGRLSSAEKQEVIERFRAGKIRLLIATTVIEVGVDVPQADVMVIDHAERMGLSQLHQLRGRVGRGGQSGSCLLLYADDLSATAQARLKILHTVADGFKIAEEDLRLRGPGEWLGTRQSGLPPFRVARLGQDADLIAAAGKAAEWLLDNDRQTAARHARRWLGGRRQA